QDACISRSLVTWMNKYGRISWPHPWLPASHERLSILNSPLQLADATLDHAIYLALPGESRSLQAGPLGHSLYRWPFCAIAVKKICKDRRKFSRHLSFLRKFRLRRYRLGGRKQLKNGRGVQAEVLAHKINSAKQLAP